jgi:hypothetical protein
MAFCPERAIEAGHSWAVLLYFLTSIPAGAFVLNLAAARLPWGGVFAGHWKAHLLQYPFYFLATYVAYWVFWLLVRVPAVNTLFACTTLTHLYRRYRAPGTTLADLTGSGRAPVPAAADAAPKAGEKR